MLVLFPRQVRELLVEPELNPAVMAKARRAMNCGQRRGEFDYYRRLLGGEREN